MVQYSTHEQNFNSLLPWVLYVRDQMNWLSRRAGIHEQVRADEDRRHDHDTAQACQATHNGPGHDELDAAGPSSRQVKAPSISLNIYV